MNTCDSIATAGPPPLVLPRPPQAKSPAGLAAAIVATDDESTSIAFACPVCASELRVAHSMREVAGVCPVCGAGVVPPAIACGQPPDGNGPAMTYRDWLRLQATDSSTPPGASASTRPLSPASLSVPVPAPFTLPEPTDPPQPQERTALPSWLWATSAIAAGLLVIGGAALIRQAGGGPPPPLTRNDTPAPIASAAEPPPSAPKASVAASASVPAPRLPKTIPSAPAPKTVPPLAALLQRPTAEDAIVVVQATRAHSFGRSAPADETFFCLKLTDATDATVTTRAYAPTTGEIGARAQLMLPWGRAQRVVVRLRWQKATSGDALAGYWQVVSLEDAASGQAALTSAR